MLYRHHRVVSLYRRQDLGHFPSLFCAEDRHPPKLHSLIEQDTQVVQGLQGPGCPSELQ